MGEAGMEIDKKDQEDISLTLDNVSLQENVVEGEQNPLQGSYNEIDNKDDTSVANHETELTMEDQRDGELLGEPGDSKLLADNILIQESCIEILLKDDSSVVNHECEDITVEEQRNRQQFSETGERFITDKILFLASSNELSVQDDSPDADQEGLEDVKMEDQIHREADSEIVHPTLVPCVSGKISAKPSMPRPALVFPLKRMLNP